MLAKNNILSLLLLLILSLSTKFTSTANADFVAEFGAKWCGPCRSMSPSVDKLIKEGYDIRPVDVDDQPFFKNAYRVSKLPTLVYVAETSCGNIEIDRVVGYQSEAQIRYFCRPRQILYDAAPIANLVRSVLGMPILVGY